jgi:hypothetical protein
MQMTRYRAAGEVDYGELPELTRALRAFGSPRRSAGSLQSLFFHPLLEARRRAADARDAAACLRAFDCAELERGLQRVIERIVSGWPDGRPAARRALRADLFERVEEYRRAIAVLAELGAAALAADDARKLESWRRWTVQLAATYGAADRGWMNLRLVSDAVATRG